jgi:serine/threonine-protein kinase HipA
MPRRPRHPPLRVLLNNRLVGYLRKAASGAIEFQYDAGWLDWEHALPVSLSLPLREDAYRGGEFGAVFDNLLPDSDALRRRVAEQVGAEGNDAYSLLAAIGRDCVGALQFLGADDGSGHDGDDQGAVGSADGEALDDPAIEKLLNGLARAPLGLDRDDEFRISVAGIQEKTALLRLGGRWLKPHGTTPTTHIFKTPIGRLPDGIDLSHSVENEYYCLKLAAAFGLPVNDAEIQTFGETRALVIERLDRRWTGDGRLIRLPQEDFCQALAVPPTRKYQSDGGPNLVQLLKLLDGSDSPAEDHATILKAQILFWLIGATDGHAKNFSIFLSPGGGFRLTPLYDVLTAQPSLDAGQIERRQFRLAMSVGASRHYRMEEIVGRHFVQSGEAAGLPRTLIREALEMMADKAGKAVDEVGQSLPGDFPMQIHRSVKAGLEERLKRLAVL